MLKNEQPSNKVGQGENVKNNPLSGLAQNHPFSVGSVQNNSTAKK